MLLILAGLLSLLLSSEWLVCAIHAYLEKDIPAALLYVVLFFVSFFMGLALIKLGLNISLKQYIILTTTPSTGPTNDSGSSGNGNTSGNGNGNGGSNPHGVGGGHRSDEDEETYNKRKLEYLASEENKYELTLRKVNAKLAFLRNKKIRLAKKDIIDETIDQELSTYIEIRDGTKVRLIATRC